MHVLTRGNGKCEGGSAYWVAVPFYASGKV